VKTLADALEPTRQALGASGVVLFAAGAFAVSAGAAVKNSLAGSYSLWQVLRLGLE
jgi:hypothetical protein